MAGATTNYGAVKPAVGEAYDVNIPNNNNDLWDTQMKARADAIKLALKALAVHGANATFGTIPALTSDLKVIFGSNPFTTDASGYVGVDMPASFPNGYIVVSMMNGDGAAASNLMFQLSTGIFTNLANRFYTRTLVANTGAAVASGTHRLNYIVIGH